MTKISIANYLIGEMEEEKAQQSENSEVENVIDNLIDKWSRKEYYNPDEQIDQ